MKVNLPVTQKERQYGEDVSIISTTNLKGIITYVNQDFIDISGFTEEELMRKNHNIVRHPDMPPAAFEDLWQTVKAGRSWRGLVKNRCKNGDHYWVDAYVTPVYEHGKLIGYQSVRSKPTQAQVDAASALYEKLRANPSAKLPKKFNARNISIKTRLGASLGLVALLVLVVSLFSIYAGDAELQQLQRHEQQLNVLAADWSSYRAAPSDGELLNKLDQQIEAVTRADSSNHSLADIHQTISNNNILAATLCSAVLIFIALIGILLVRTVVMPMQRIVELAKGMAGGNLMERIDHGSQDEVGQMVQAMKLLQARLRTVFGRFAESSQQLAAAAAQLSSSSEHAMQNMHRQQSETDQVATAMNEMSATVQEVANNTAQTANAARDAEQEAEEGKVVVSRARQAIEGLAQEVQRTSEVVHELERDSDQISTITNVISGIAEQTNLLALNAAIEAARAGESGRGFAVVADEVRTLAGRTQQATGEIRSMIDNLRQGIERAVAVMATGREQADSAVSESQSTEKSLHTIVGAVGRISDMTTQVATATEEQTAVAEEMNRNVSAISHLAETTTEQAHDIQHSGTELATMAQRLQELIGQFDIGGGANFDFHAAKSAHLAWKARLRAFLDGDSSALSASQATSHHDCALGKWYYGEGLAHYGQLSAMKAIEAPHAELHTLIKQIMELKHQGNQQEAERLYRRIEPLSHEIVRQLDQVEEAAKSNL